MQSKSYKTIVWVFVISMGLIFYRMVHTDTYYFAFLFWNLFLATVPLFISTIIDRLKLNHVFFLLPLLFIWLIFLPNSPYVITDFMHLKPRKIIPMWYDFAMLFFCGLYGLLVMSFTMHQVYDHVKSLFKVGGFYFFSAVIIALCSFGIFLGRFIRMNSWDIFNPDQFIKSLMHVLANFDLSMMFSYTLFSFGVMSLWHYLVSWSYFGLRS